MHLSPVVDRDVAQDVVHTVVVYLLVVHEVVHVVVVLWLVVLDVLREARNAVVVDQLVAQDVVVLYVVVVDLLVDHVVVYVVVVERDVVVECEVAQLVV